MRQEEEVSRRVFAEYGMTPLDVYPYLMRQQDAKFVSAMKEAYPELADTGDIRRSQEPRPGSVVEALSLTPPNGLSLFQIGLWVEKRLRRRVGSHLDYILEGKERPYCTLLRSAIIMAAIRAGYTQLNIADYFGVSEFTVYRTNRDYKDQFKSAT